MGLVYISKLRKLKLPAAGYELAMLLMEHGGYAGLVTRTNKELAEELGASTTRISALKCKLERAGILFRLGPKTVFLNPVFYWRGSAVEQNRAVQRWSDLHPVGIVKARKTA